jgi:hypothetical protein
MCQTRVGFYLHREKLADALVVEEDKVQDQIIVGFGYFKKDI